MMQERKLCGISVYFIAIGLYLVALSVVVILMGYKDSFLFMNGQRYTWLDWPMFVITHLGDSMILASVLSFILVWKKPKAAFNIIVVVIISGVLGQILKVVFFEGWDRPLRVFNESPIVHTLPHYRLFHNSFPSGHSITAISAFTALIWSIKPSQRMQLVIALIAVSITYSRIYLGVHFPGDVLAGSIFGLATALLILPHVNKQATKINFNNQIKITIAVIAVVLVTSGAWLLRVYFPLI
jgi:undecaprenyl-diphosphatase